MSSNVSRHVCRVRFRIEGIVRNLEVDQAAMVFETIDPHLYEMVKVHGILNSTFAPVKAAKLEKCSTVTVTQADSKIVLKDGRALGYSEFGDRAGFPMIYCHGFPSSRLEGALVDAAAKRRRVRLIVPDRPGYGLSDHYPGRRLKDWPDDIEQLVDQLGLHQFAVLGVSGGGPYALALAWKFSDRLSTIGVVSGLGPVYRQEAVLPMQWPARFGFWAARNAPRLLDWVYGGLLGRLMYVHPELALQMLTVSAPLSDRAILKQPQIRSALCASVREGLRQGSRGALEDFTLYAGDWGFELELITRPILLWHGEADATVPALHARLLAESLPNATVRLWPGEGHFSLPIGHAEEMLEAVVSAPIG